MLYNINSSYLYYQNDFGIINDYCQNIVYLIKQVLINNPEISINITFLDNKYQFNNNNKTLQIHVNYEHTLVKQGGIGADGFPIGNILDDNNQYYLVRICNYEEINKFNIIIDYSIPNIYNVYTSNLFKEFSKKHIHIYSSIYESYFIKENRNITTLTTFINTFQPRRQTLLQNINSQNIPHINVNNCFQKDDLQNLYKNTKILINIHQTDHHDTFEELRVLPALQCGVIVICENSPLSNLIPYNDYIIWSSYDNILNTVKDVLNKYDYFYDSIFLKEKKTKLDEFNSINYNTLNDIIINF
uniref:Exostosin GT47 domain-containing protein n=1 Tax=viral metagenome TaxID=1070528 RepID=A0A6C0EQE8_9ZZZZ